MAKYNRDFLVPYLESLCMLHIAKWKIDNKRKAVSNGQNNLTRDINRLREPQEPAYEDTGTWVFGIILGAILVVVSWLDIFLISFLAGIGGWIILVLSTIFLISDKKKNEEKEAQYYYTLNEYHSQKEKLQKKDDEYNTYAFVQYSLCQAETEKIDEALKKAYDANVIPRRYRDIYVAVYLYEWFSSSMADDLDMALNMYVLEEIKDRLDNIISQLAQSLLNQRAIIENQQRSMEQQELYRQEMMAKLDRLQVSAEEHSRYLGMIEANTAATAYFAVADYLRKV